MKRRISISWIFAVLVTAGCVEDGQAPFEPADNEVTAARSENLVEPGMLRAILETRTSTYGAAQSVPTGARIGEEGDPQSPSCTTIDFEGVGDFLPVGTVAGATFGGSWFGLVDQDDGGSGPFANEPSPSTVALQLDGHDIDIVLDAPIAFASFHYSALQEALPLVFEGLDDADEIVASTTGTTVGANSDPPPCAGDPTGWFCGWEPLEISASGPTITTIRIHGPEGWETGWAIDDLMLCSADPNDEGGDPPEGEYNVTIDIKPGSDQNTINPNSGGKLKVVLFGADDLNVSDIDPSSITLGDGEDDDTPVALKGGNRPMIQAVDMNADRVPDLMMHFDVGDLVENGDLTWESTELLLTASLLEPEEAGREGGAGVTGEEGVASTGVAGAASTGGEGADDEAGSEEVVGSDLKGVDMVRVVPDDGSDEAEAGDETETTSEGGDGGDEDRAGDQRDRGKGKKNGHQGGLP